MAAVLSKVQSNMVINYKTGVDSQGKDIIKGQRFSKIKVNAPDDNILNVGTSLASLLKDEFVSIVKEDESVVNNG